MFLNFVFFYQFYNLPKLFRKFPFNVTNVIFHEYNFWHYIYKKSKKLIQFVGKSIYQSFEKKSSLLLYVTCFAGVGIFINSIYVLIPLKKLDIWVKIYLMNEWKFLYISWGLVLLVTQETISDLIFFNNSEFVKTQPTIQWRENHKAKNKLKKIVIKLISLKAQWLKNTKKDKPCNVAKEDGRRRLGSKL